MSCFLGVREVRILAWARLAKLAKGWGMAGLTTKEAKSTVAMRRQRGCNGSFKNATPSEARDAMMALSPAGTAAINREKSDKKG